MKFQIPVLKYGRLDRLTHKTRQSDVDTDKSKAICYTN